jgi:DinB superfamily
MADSAKKAEMRKRVDAARERLRRITKSSARGPIGPASDDRWHRGHVMGHAAEALNFWTTQFRAVRGGASEVGRGDEGNQKRSQGIDRGEAVAEEELQQALDEAVGDVLNLLDEMTDEELELEVVFRSRDGDRPARLDELLEMLVIGHLEEHITQLAALD